MFSIFKKKSASVDLSWLGTDMHSHLVPGIDDGAHHTEDSLHLLKGLANLGYNKIITTPHILWEIYPNTSEIITAEANELKQAIRQQNIAVEFRAAAEYFIDDHFVQLLKDKTPLLTLKDNLVLVEFSMLTAPFDLLNVLFELQLHHYQPVIAHPERYVYLKGKRSFYDELKDHGCLFQLNLLSLTGHYGTTVLDLAEYLAKGDYYDYAGTDMHTDKHLQSLQKLSGNATLQRLKDSGRLRNAQL